MSKSMNFCYSECIYLSLTETQQNAFKGCKKPPHFCRKYSKQVKHFKYHPELLACEECLPNTPQQCIQKGLK